jgi:hypothetical protein
MECENLSYSKSKESKFTSRFGSNFVERHKKTYLAEYQQSLASPMRGSKQGSIDKTSGIYSLRELNTTPTPTGSIEKKLNHYSSLLNFKQKLATPLSKLPLDSKCKKRQPSQDFRINYDRVGEEHEIWNTINLKTLHKARDSVRRSGLEDVSWTYKRQLRQFCIEMLRVLND